MGLRRGALVGHDAEIWGSGGNGPFFSCVVKGKLWEVVLPFTQPKVRVTVRIFTTIPHRGNVKSPMQ